MINSVKIAQLIVIMLVTIAIYYGHYKGYYRVRKIISIVLFLIILYFVTTRCSEPAKIYFPEGFYGRFYLFQNEKEGDEERYKNIFWRQYVVDKHGVSLSKYDLTWGILLFKLEGCFYDSVGNITKKIPILLGDSYSHDKISDTLHLFLFGASITGDYDEPQNHIHYNSGLLCYPQHVDSLFLDRIENTEVERNPENIVIEARKRWNEDKRVFHRRIIDNADE